MKFLIVSERGDFSGAAIQLALEGNQVKIWYKEPRARGTQDGILDQVKTIAEGTQMGPDVIVFDMSGMGAIAEKLKNDGWKVVGGGLIQDELEHNRPFAMRTMEAFGIRTPHTFAFKGIQDAAKFAVENPKRYVFKPSGSMPPGLTFVAEDIEDLLAFLSNLKRVQKVDGECILQQFVPGTELSTEIWYTHGKPIPFPNATIEVKKFMYGNVGQATGAMAAIMWCYPTRQPRVVQQGLKRLQILLEKKDYTGPLDLNAIIHKEKVYGLEFTPRFGYNALYGWLPLLKEDLGAALYRMANGDTTPLRLDSGFGCALRVSIPPFPLDDNKDTAKIYAATKGIHVGGAPEDAWCKSIYPLDVYRTKDGLFTAGLDGVVAETVGSGRSVMEAYQGAEDAFKRLRLPNKQARLKDIVPIAERRMSELRAQNYEVPDFFAPYDIPVQSTQETPSPSKEVKREPPSRPSNPVPAHMGTTSSFMVAKPGDGPNQ